MTCTVEGCDRSTIARGLCTMHYQRRLRGAPLGPSGPISRGGAGNANWKGGRVRGGHEGRYWMRYRPDHPAANTLGYVLEHRLVAEDQVERYLTPDEVVHHVDGDPGNNDPENLEVMSQAEHVRRHHTKAS